MIVVLQARKHKPGQTALTTRTASIHRQPSAPFAQVTLTSNKILHVIFLARPRVRINLDIPVLPPDAAGAGPDLMILRVTPAAAVVQGPLHGCVAVLLEAALVVLVEWRKAGSLALVLHHEDDVVLEALVAVGNRGTPLNLWEGRISVSRNCENCCGLRRRG